MTITLLVNFVFLTSAQVTDDIDKSTIDNNIDNLEMFSNKQYSIIFEKVKKKDQVNQYYINLLTHQSQSSKKVLISGINKSNPYFFGHHLTRNEFRFFESVYDAAKKTRTIFLHTYNYENGELKNRNIHNYQDKNKENPTFTFTATAQADFSAIYIFRSANLENKSESQIIYMDLNSSKIDSKTMIFEEKLAGDSPHSVHLNRRGTLSAVHQINVKKDVIQTAIFKIDCTNLKENKLSKIVLFENEDRYFSTHKSYIDETQTIQIIGIVKTNSDERKTNFMRLAVHGDQGVVANSDPLDIRIKSGLKLHSWLTLSNDISIIVLSRNEKITVRENSPSTQNSPSTKPSLSATSGSGANGMSEEEQLRRKEEQLRNESNSNNTNNDVDAINQDENGTEKLYIYCYVGFKRLLWSDSIQSNLDKSTLNNYKDQDEIKQIYFWSDGIKVFCRYNTIASERTNTGAISRDQNPTNVKVINTVVREYELKTGRFVDNPRSKSDQAAIIAYYYPRFLGFISNELMLGLGKNVRGTLSPAYIKM